MKKIHLLGLGLAVGLMSCEKQAGVESLESQVDSLSYALGVDTSVNLPKSFEEVNMDAFLLGVDDSYNETTKFDAGEGNQMVRSFFMAKQTEMMKENQARMQAETAGTEYQAPEKVVEKGVYESGNSDLGNKIDSISYALGLGFYTTANRSIPDMELTVFEQGVSDVRNGKTLLIEESMCQPVIQEIMQFRQSEEMQKQREEAIKQAELEYGEIKKAGEEFLLENASKEGVITTESGLQYEIIQEGNDVHPDAVSSVTIHYVGTTLEGETFDSSRDRGEPSTFGLNQVISGWTEGLQLMGEGAVYKFYIPQELAYGATPRDGGPIKPFMTLVFEVELISVNQ
ncbi:MAG: FKBP-type peptidyl-prolyl cis-trans isomerase N-terminal domain-containing protein [Flavobacteriaceae bacterium]